MVQRVTRILQNKRSADYVQSLANNTAPRQVYLYQRYIEQARREHGGPDTPLKSRGDSISVPDYDSQTANLIKKVQKESSNLDIEFTDIEEGNTTEEVSPNQASIDKRRHTMHVGNDFQANANLKKAVQALHKTNSVGLPKKPADSSSGAA